MTTIDAAHAQVSEATGTGPVLGAAWDAFEVIRLTANAYSSRHTPGFVTWMAVIPPACEGRDAIGFAPSNPPESALVIDPADLGELPEDQAAGKLAALAASCAATLSGLRPHIAKDSAAITHAITAAEEISGLLTADK